MKKIFIILAFCLLLTGCTLPRRTQRINYRNDNYIETSYGSFTIPSTWIKREDHSTSSKYFFANRSDKNDIPNNISVEMGTNRYSKDEHMSFKTAIQTQIAAQISRRGATMTGSGSTTKNGYIVYTFRINMPGQTTVQHYIVGDYKYVLVHETIWNGDGIDTDNAAKEIVNSFRWKE